MKKTAVFPGSFDPLTLGHVDIIKRALPLFDSIVIAIGNNPEKKPLFPIRQRREWIQKTFENNPAVSVDIYSGLTVEFCKKIKAAFIIRGVRGSTDFEFERDIAMINKSLADEIETLFFMSSPQFIAVRSAIIRDVIEHGGDVSRYVPPVVKFK